MTTDDCSYPESELWVVLKDAENFNLLFDFFRGYSIKAEIEFCVDGSMSIGLKDVSREVKGYFVAELVEKLPIDSYEIQT